MTGTNHAITGAVIALTVKQPAIAVPLSFISHFFQDLVPHFDFFSGPNQEHLFERKFNIVLITDFLLSVTLMVVLAFLFPAQKWLIWGCMVAAACPDLAQAYYHLYLGKIKKQKPNFDPISKLHYKLQWSSTPQGLVVEVLWAVAGLYIISRLR